MAESAELVEQGKELTEAERESLFQSGLAVAKGIVADATEPEGVGAEPEGVGAEPEGSTGDDGGAPSPDPVVLAGLTETQLKEALAKANQYDALRAEIGGEHQKMYGKFGEIQKEIKRLSGGKPSKITAESLKRMSEEYPDLAEVLAEDLAGLVLEKGGSSQSTEDIEAIVNARLADRMAEVTGQMAAMNQTLAVDLLTVRHPDWQEKKASTDWKLFVGTLPQERQAEVQTSQDWRVAAKLLDDFDAWQVKGKQGKTNRLERAITPSGSPPELSRKILSDEALFNEGLKSSLKQRGILR